VEELVVPAVDTGVGPPDGEELGVGEGLLEIPSVGPEEGEAEGSLLANEVGVTLPPLDTPTVGVGALSSGALTEVVLVLAAISTSGSQLQGIRIECAQENRYFVP
jgi:hypothetical protein